MNNSYLRVNEWIAYSNSDLSLQKYQQKVSLFAQFRRALRRHNLSFHQMKGILNFLQSRDHRERRYLCEFWICLPREKGSQRHALDVIASPYPNSPSLVQPTTSYILNEDPSAGMVWVQNDGFRLRYIHSETSHPGNIGHWDEYGPANDRHGPRLAQSWNLPGPIMVENSLSPAQVAKFWGTRR